MNKLFLSGLFFWFLCAAALAVQPLAAQNNQRIIPLDSDVYHALDILFLEQGMSIPSTVRPFSVDEAQMYLDKIKAASLSRAGRNAYRYLEEELGGRVLYGENGGFAFNGSIILSAESYLHTDPQVPWEYGYEERQPLLALPLELYVLDNFYAVMEPMLQKDPFTVDAPETVTNIFTDWSAVDFLFPHRALLSVGGKHWNLFFGRDQTSWGNGNTGNLLLSGYADYYDQVRFVTYWNAFKFSTVYLSLENWDPADLSRTEELFKAFLAHRFDFRFFDRFNISISEGLIFEGQYPEIRYLNPFMVYHNWFINDQLGNIIFAIEGEFSPYKWINIYGQIVADQITSQYEKERYGAETEGKADAFGYIAGIECAVPLGPGHLYANFEWAYTDPWLYLIAGQPDFITQRKFVSNYLGTIRLITKTTGYEAGPDAIVYNFTAEYTVWDLFSAFLGFEHLAKGRVTLETPYETGTEAMAMTTPSGPSPVFKTQIFGGGEVKLFRFFTFGTGVTWVHYENFDHVAGAVRDDLQWVCTLTFTL